VFIGDHKSPIFGFLGWDRGDKRASRAPTPHPASASVLLQTKALRQSTIGRPLRAPWVALGWPKRHPIPNPIPIRQRVADSPSTNYHLPSTVFVKDRLPAAWAAGSRNTSTPSELYRILFAFVKSHSNSRKYGRQRPKKPQDDFGVTRPLNLRKSCGARFAFRHSLRNVYSCLGDGSLCESHRHPELSSHSGIE
jgi:hypothetical protein